MSPSMPLVWLSRWRIAICSLASARPMRTPGRTSATVVSSDSRPSPTSCMTIVVVHTLVMDPIWNSESEVARTPVSAFSTPCAAAATSCPSAHTPNAAPGTPSSTARSCNRVAQRSSTSAVVINRTLADARGRIRHSLPVTVVELPGLLGLGKLRIALARRPLTGDRPGRGPHPGSAGARLDGDVHPGVRPLHDRWTAQLQDPPGAPRYGCVQVTVQDDNRPGETLGGLAGVPQVQQVAGIAQPSRAQPRLLAEQRVVPGPQEKTVCTAGHVRQLDCRAGLPTIGALQPGAHEDHAGTGSLRCAVQNGAHADWPGRCVERIRALRRVVVTGNHSGCPAGLRTQRKSAAYHLRRAVIGDVAEHENGRVPEPDNHGERGLEDLARARAPDRVVPDAVLGAGRGDVRIGQHREPRGAPVAPHLECRRIG